MRTNLKGLYFALLVCVLLGTQTFADTVYDDSDFELPDLPAPVITESVVTESVITDSTANEPVANEPIASEPVVTEISVPKADSVVSVDSSPAELVPDDSLSVEPDTTRIDTVVMSETVYSRKKEMVTKYENMFSIRILCNYNYVAFASSEYDGGTLKSHRPVDLGIGLGFKDFAFDVKFSLPFTLGKGKAQSTGFNTGLDFFPGNLWLQLKYHRYGGLSLDTDEDDTIPAVKEVDFRQRDIYLSVLWVRAGKEKFSARAPYFLDRIQTESSGSFIFGGKIQSTNAVDRAKVLDYYSKERDIYSTWSHGGYSYTWVLDGNFFVNGWALGGLAIGLLGNGDFGFFPDFNAKVAIGQWHKSWSWNAVMQASYSPSIYWGHVEQRYLSSFEILVVKRF